MIVVALVLDFGSPAFADTPTCPHSHRILQVAASAVAQVGDVAKATLAFRLKLITTSLLTIADVAELADALDSKSSVRKDVWVRPPPSVLPYFKPGLPPLPPQAQVCSILSALFQIPKGLYREYLASWKNRPSCEVRPPRTFAQPAGDLCSRHHPCALYLGRLLHTTS